MCTRPIDAEGVLSGHQFPYTSRPGTRPQLFSCMFESTQTRIDFRSSSSSRRRCRLRTSVNDVCQRRRQRKEDGWASEVLIGVSEKTNISYDGRWIARRDGRARPGRRRRRKEDAANPGELPFWARMDWVRLVGDASFQVWQRQQEEFEV